MRALVIAALATVLLMPGCGDSSEGSAKPETVDDAQVEKGIKDDLSTSSAKVTKAKCPDDVPVKEGDTFTCTVTFDSGATGKAKVTQGARNNYSSELKPGSVQVPGSVADAAVEKSLAAQGIPDATVNCPDTIIVKTGTTVSCAVSSAQGNLSGSVTFTFSDAEGTVDASSVEA